jgi:hypothetical protein
MLKGGDQMPAIMSLEEPRQRGTVLGERTDGRRVGEAEHYFRCKACNGWIDGRDFVWIEDHEGELRAPRTGSSPLARQIISACPWRVRT